MPDTKLIKNVQACDDRETLIAIQSCVTSKLSIPTQVGKGNYVKVSATVVRETERAYQLDTYAPRVFNAMWFPKSQIASVEYGAEVDEFLISEYIWRVKCAEVDKASSSFNEAAYKQAVEDTESYSHEDWGSRD